MTTNALRAAAVKITEEKGRVASQNIRGVFPKTELIIIDSPLATL